MDTETFATDADARDALAQIIAAQDGSYDVDAIADDVIVIAPPTEGGAYRLRIIDEAEGFWEAVAAHAL